MTESKGVEITEILEKALAIAIEMTNPQRYSVLNKKELAFVHHTLSFYEEYEEEEVGQKIRNIIESSREMFFYNAGKRKTLTEIEMEFLGAMKFFGDQIKVNGQAEQNIKH